MDDWKEFLTRWHNREVTLEEALERLLQRAYDQEAWSRVWEANIEAVRRGHSSLSAALEAVERRLDAFRIRQENGAEQYKILVRQYEALINRNAMLARQHEALLQRHEALAYQHEMLARRVVALESRLPPDGDEAGANGE